MASAIVAGAPKDVAALSVRDVDTVTGEGVVGLVDGRRLAIGVRKLLDRLAIELPPNTMVEELRSDGQTVDGQLAGLLGVADPLKANVADAIRSLKDMGLRVVMLTGDNEITARAVAAKVGITKSRHMSFPPTRPQPSRPSKRAATRSPWRATA